MLVMMMVVRIVDAADGPGKLSPKVQELRAAAHEPQAHSLSCTCTEPTQKSIMHQTQQGRNACDWVLVSREIMSAFVSTVWTFGESRAGHFRLV